MCVLTVLLCSNSRIYYYHAKPRPMVLINASKRLFVHMQYTGWRLKQWKGRVMEATGVVRSIVRWQVERRGKRRGYIDWIIGEKNLPTS
jgi:hypothetical protein